MPRKALETRIKEESIDLKKAEEKLNKLLEKKSEDILNNMENKIDDILDYKINKRLKDEEKRYMKSQRFKIVRLNLIIIVLLIIIGYFSYCLYDVDYFNIRTKVIEQTNDNISVRNEVSQSSEDNKNDELNKEFIIDRYQYLVDNLLIDDVKIFDLFRRDITKDDISNDLKLKIAYKNIASSNINIENDIVSFTSESLKNSFIKIFGENSNLKNETFAYNSIRFMFYKDSYLGLKEDSNAVGFLFKIVDVNLSEDKISFKVIVAKISDKNELLNIDDEVVSDTYKNDDLSNYEDILTKAMITFEKYSDDYVFASIKKQ